MKRRYKNMKLPDFQEQLSEYQTFLTNRLDLSQNSYIAYQRDITQFIHWFQSVDLSKVTSISQITDNYIVFLLHEKHLKPRSVKRKIVTLKSFMRFYCEKHREFINPFLEHPLRLPKSKEIPRILSQQEVISLLSAAQSHLKYATSYHSIFAIRDLAILDLLLCTGIRIGELSNIAISDFDFKTGILQILGKGHRERLIYISSQDVIKEIKHWIMQREKLAPQTPHLFLNKYGKKLSIYAIENIFYKYRNLAQINSNATPHYLRHTFASVDTFAF